ncbi:hypothetical protein CEXT_652341 [Caerostris extrusa]|uniref:Uncharacterized protein n=1 Tax=Caerostris extrusa TaxID=172846 RepID=A0AAV4YBP3_CAEEX|nr:hypothetical protein CEXT_652341 [Caerostris extrusa]
MTSENENTSSKVAPRITYTKRRLSRHTLKTNKPSGHVLCWKRVTSTAVCQHNSGNLQESKKGARAVASSLLKSTQRKIQFSASAASNGGL